MMAALDLDLLDFAKGNGLVTVVAQDADTGVVLMVAHADREALTRTIASGEMHYRSRTRGLWHKGGTSGNVQRVVSLTADCDGDAVLARVRPAGPYVTRVPRRVFATMPLGPTRCRCSIAQSPRAQHRWHRRRIATVPAIRNNCSPTGISASRNLARKRWSLPSPV